MINIAPGMEETISLEVCIVVHIMQLEAISYSKIREFGLYRYNMVYQSTLKK